MTNQPPPARQGDKCAQCGLVRREHHHDGAAYGICGKFVDKTARPDGDALETTSHRVGDELARWSKIEMALRARFPTLRATGIEIDAWPELIAALPASGEAAEGVKPKIEYCTHPDYSDWDGSGPEPRPAPPKPAPDAVLTSIETILHEEIYHDRDAVSGIDFGDAIKRLAALAAPMPPADGGAQACLDILILCGDRGGKQPNETYPQYLRRLIDFVTVRDPSATGVADNAHSDYAPVTVRAALIGTRAAEPIAHTRSCGYYDGDCTCCLEERKALATEQTMHRAWRKRAEEAEAKLANPPVRGDREARAEDIATALCLVDGHDPDDEAPRTEMCDGDNMPVPWWMVYVEYAESLLAKFNVPCRQPPQSSSDGEGR
jgi:hypothetical protein